MCRRLWLDRRNGKPAIGALHSGVRCEAPKCFSSDSSKPKYDDAQKFQMTLLEVRVAKSKAQVISPRTPFVPESARQRRTKVTREEINMQHSALCRASLAQRLRKNERQCSKLLAIYCLTIITFLIPAYGQDFRASITGQVSDSTGAAISGASITAVNVDTQVKSSTTSNDQGVYSLLYLLPGIYTVTADKEHFQTTVYNNVRLDSGQQLGLNLDLKTGSLAQQIVVTADSVDLDTVSASLGGVVDQTRVENMPTAGLMVFDDVTLVEGVRLEGLGFNLTPRNNGGNYTVSGAQTNANVFYMNGAPVSDQGDWYFVPNQESVQQVTAVAMPYDAQYGRTQGGAFTATVKNGTNAYHGSIYEYYGNQALDANTWIANLDNNPKTTNIRNTYGIESSGPIRKDKTFYFGSYEAFRQNQPLPTTKTVPPPSWINGDFSGSGYIIYDPLSTFCAKKNASGGCTTYGRTPFLNDIIPASRISPIGKAILAMYPAPTQSGATSNYFAAGPRNVEYQQYIGRIDQNFSQNTRIYVLYTHEYDYEFSSGNSFTNAASTASIPTSFDHNAILDLTHIFSPSMVLDLKASYGHITGITSTGTAVQNNYLASNLGFNMPEVSTTPHQNIVPAISITGMTDLFGNTQSGTAHADADFSGSVTQLIGRHNLHYGAEFMDIQQAPTGVLGTPNGSFTFGANFTQGNPLAATTGQGNPVADTLLGYPSSGSIGWTAPTFITVHYYGAFIQDDFKVLPNLSFNLGLRWDVNKSPRDRHNRINAGFCLTCINPLSSQVNYAVAPGLQSPLLGGLTFAGVNGAPSEPYKVQWNDWQPRFGFSWGALRDTVVRGGYGIYYPWEPLDVDTTGFSQTTTFVSSLDGNLTPDNYLNSGTPYPNGAVAPTGASAGLATAAGTAISYNNTSRRLRMVQHWSLGVQRRLPQSLLLDVEYVGSNDHAMPVTSQLGVIPTSLQQQCNLDISICNTNAANPFYGVVPATAGNGSSTTIPAWRLQRAFPLFNGVAEQRLPTGSSHYNALDVRVERRVKNLNFVFNYAYSNWMDRDSYLNSGNFQDAELTRMLDDGDVKHYVSINIVYPIPGTRKTGFVGALTNGWLLDSTIIRSSGTPLDLPAADFHCSTLAPAGGQTRAHWFNNDESCWTNLGTWEPRSTPSSVGFLRDPAQSTWNPAIHKRFKLPREGMFAQFRMEALNGANHPTWGAPSTANGTPPKFAPDTSWTGFGTLPTTQTNTQRHIIASLKILF